MYYMYIVLLYYLLSCKSILYISDNKGMSSVEGNVNDCLVNKWVINCNLIIMRGRERRRERTDREKGGEKEGGGREGGRGKLIIKSLGSY